MLTSDGQIDYETLVGEAMREAMRGVVRRVLTDVAENGLRGDHHYYISFNTNAPGVSLSKRLKERYPDEMTIVLQHRFWDLAVHPDRFEVKLAFNSIPERLVVPFDALKVFVDPSVRFGHQFEDPEEVGAEAADDVPSNDARGSRATGRSGGAVRAEKKRLAPRKKPVEAASEPPTPAAVPSASASPPDAAGDAAPEARPGDRKDATAQPAAEAGKVVSLDQFRKK